MLYNHLLCNVMYIPPIDTWLTCFKDSFLCCKNCIINYFLLWVKFPIRGKCYSYIGAISIIFCPHVTKNKTIVFDFPVVDNIVKCCRVSWARTDTIIRFKSGSCCAQVVVLEYSFTLEFLISWSDGCKHFFMGLRGKHASEFHNSNFFVRLYYSRFI